MILGIADPFGILEPGEVFVQFSSPMTDEHNLPVTSLEGKKLIVARHPSLIPSDMQAFKAVFRQEFRDFCKLSVLNEASRHSKYVRTDSMLFRQIMSSSFPAKAKSPALQNSKAAIMTETCFGSAFRLS